ncbi:hypothetical protein B0T16DRAFT_460422 [Cercophora newfieldiana]|uniref:Protein kinase domain-containing protein n=1 Tax=Cercophora newfieldiana TaxID=92897 RepID=A0AA40CMU8_9PEZI|nr:hypothetical protein B0T16DRAFT_460422 [Cercophora newfieldiana]
MQDLQILQDGGYRGAGLKSFKLSCTLSAFPEQILELGDTLEELDLSGTGLSSLPPNFGAELSHLKVATFSNCKFEILPKELASCPALEVVSFRANSMREVLEDSLPPTLLSLDLTDNQITSLPSRIGHCTQLEKLLLPGNQLQTLPSELSRCTKLSVLRLNSNRLATLPDWLLSLPSLAFLSFSSNPCASPATNGIKPPFGLANIPWSDLQVQDNQERDPSHPITQGLWNQSPDYAEDIAIQLFRGTFTETGTPADELAARLAAGAHESLMTILGQIYNHPDENAESPSSAYHGGIVTQLIPTYYAPLGLNHEVSSPQQQVEAADQGNTPLTAACAISMLTGLAGAAAHLHNRGIHHGNLTARNILASREDEHALLGGFTAATIYGRGHPQAEQLEKTEVLAFGQLIDDVLELITREEGDAMSYQGLESLSGRCASAEVAERPTFEEVEEVLQDMMGWRGMMRIPTIPGSSS